MTPLIDLTFDDPLITWKLFSHETTLVLPIDINEVPHGPIMISHLILKE